MSTEPKPEATFTNAEDGMESYVYKSAMVPGTFNVSMKDLDSGIMLPTMRCNIALLEDAIAHAKKIAGIRE
jgi:hypothetical protein